MVSLDAYRRNIRSEKRNAILDASLHVFLTQGFQNAGMAAIAKQADVSTATLYKHFSSKDQLFGEMVEMHVTNFQVLPQDCAQTTMSSDVGLMLKGLSGGFVRLLSDTRTVSIFRTIIGEVDRFPVLQRLIYKKGRDPFKHMLVEFLQHEDVAAQLDCKEPLVAAEWYIGLLTYWLIFVRVLNPDITYNDKRVDELVDECTAMFLARYRHRAPSS